MIRRFACLAVVAVLLSSCGKGDSSSSTSSGGGSSSSSSSQKSPEEAWKNMQALRKAGDGKGLWNCVCAKSRKDMLEDPDLKKNMDQMRSLPDEQLEGVAKDMGTTAKELKAMSTEDFVVMQFTKAVKDPKEQEKIDKEKWKGAKIDGDKAEVNTVDADGKDDWALLVKEDGTWKVDLKASEELKKQHPQ